MEKDRKETTNSGNRYEETHIDNVETYAPNAEKVENNHTYTVNVQINFKFSFHIRLPFVSRWFGTSCSYMAPPSDEVMCDFWPDDLEQTDESTCQLSGSPEEIARFLWLVDKELGEDSVASIRYICEEKGVDCSNLTLHQAIEKAEHESGL